MTLIKGIKRVMDSQYNSAAPRKGMTKLMEVGPNALTKLKLMDIITIKTVLAASKDEVKAAATTPPTEPAIKTRGDAHEEADRHNLASQAIIRAK